MLSRRKEVIQAQGSFQNVNYLEGKKCYLEGKKSYKLKGVFKMSII